jgi:hypothetical protein
MELPWGAEKELLRSDRIAGLAAQKGAEAVKEEMDFVFIIAMGVIASMPGDPLMLYQMIDKHRVTYFHGSYMI